MQRSGWSLALAWIAVTVMVGCTSPSKEDERHAVSERPPAVEGAGITWLDVFGSKPGDEHNLYCLMGSGFFGIGVRTVHEDTWQAMQEWFRQHPDAAVVEVVSIGPAVVDDPDSKVVYVWIKDGDDILNIDLVRKGYFGAHGLRTRVADELLQVPVEEYQAVVDAGIQAETLAKREKLGLWDEAHEAERAGADVGVAGNGYLQTCEPVWPPVALDNSVYQPPYLGNAWVVAMGVEVSTGGRDISFTWTDGTPIRPAFPFRVHVRSVAGGWEFDCEATCRTGYGGFLVLGAAEANGSGIQRPGAPSTTTETIGVSSCALETAGEVEVSIPGTPVSVRGPAHVLVGKD